MSPKAMPKKIDVGPLPEGWPPEVHVAKVCPKCDCALSTMGAFAIAGLACECRCHDSPKLFYGAR